MINSISVAPSIKPSEMITAGTPKRMRRMIQPGTGARWVLEEGVGFMQV